MADRDPEDRYHIPDLLYDLMGSGQDRDTYRIRFNRDHGRRQQDPAGRAQKIMGQRINNYHLERGVTIIDPDNAYIGASRKDRQRCYHLSRQRFGGHTIGRGLSCYPITGFWIPPLEGYGNSKFGHPKSRVEDRATVGPLHT